jgi:hypothetical protein
MPNNYQKQANLTDMGMDVLGGNNVLFKRKYRWTLAIDTNCNAGKIPPYFVKLASRPNLTIEETEINFLNSKMYIPGKASWETITVTLYDLSGSDTSAGVTALYSWLATTFNFTQKGVPYSQSSLPGQRGGGGTSGNGGGYSATAFLDLYDGCGNNLENWQLDRVWPQAVNFGELDYSSSEEVTIELTLRYSEVKWTGFCSGTVDPCCDGCVRS